MKRTSLSDLRARAEESFSTAVSTGDCFQIASAMDRLNRIDGEMLKENSANWLKTLSKDIEVDWDSPENRAIEERRKYLKEQFEWMTGEKIKDSEIFDGSHRRISKPKVLKR